MNANLASTAAVVLSVQPLNLNPPAFTSGTSFAAAVVEASAAGTFLNLSSPIVVLDDDYVRFSPSYKLVSVSSTRVIESIASLGYLLVFASESMSAVCTRTLHGWGWSGRLTLSQKITMEMGATDKDVTRGVWSCGRRSEPYRLPLRALPAAHGWGTSRKACLLWAHVYEWRHTCLLTGMPLHFSVNNFGLTSYD